MEKEDVSTLFSVKVLKINFQRLFYSSGRMAVSETVQPCHLGNSLLPQLARRFAPVSSMMAERHMPVRIKRLMKTNFQRLFYSSGRMAELFLQMYQISLVMLVIF